MDEDLERRREVRRQKREEMQKEAEKVSYSKLDDDDDEEAARERRRRARQERLRNMENEEISSTAPELNSTNSVTDTSFSALISTPTTNDDDQALLERLAKREERRQRRMKEAMERQKEFDPTVVDGDTNIDTPASEDRPTRGSPLRAKEEESPLNSWREKEEKNDEEKVEEVKEEVQVTVAVKEETLLVKAEAVLTTAPEDKKDDKEEGKKPQTSHLTEQESIEEKNKETVSRSEVMEEKPKLSFLRDKKDPGKQQNADDISAKVKKPEKQVGRLGLRSPEVQKQDPLVKQEAERKLVELKRLRNQTESEEFEKMKQKQQSAEAELEELKRKREERKKVLEEEEKQKQQQQAEKRVKEEQERQKMREEIERRRAEAAEKKRQKEESGEESKAPFKCMSPKGASTKIGEKAEFLSKSAQKTPMKVLHTPLVCKIGNRLEQYTSAVQTKDVKSPKSPVKDLPVVEGVRNIKSLWEKGNVQSCAAPNPATTAAAPKEAAGINVGVASRINSWKTKTPETKTPETKIPETKAAEMKPTETKALDARAPAEKPAGGKAELKPADVSKTRGLWETKSPAPAKVFAVKSRSVANGTRK